MPLKKNQRIIILFFTCLFLPIILKPFSAITTKELFIFYLINFLLVVSLLHKYNSARYRLAYRIQEVQEIINTQESGISKERQYKVALQAKQSRYFSLKEIIEEINQHLELETVVERLTAICFSLIANQKGVCILYLVDPGTQKLTIAKAKKEDKALVIKAKEGDIFDLWVLRQNSPLLIEDIKKDFRFDLEKIIPQDKRPIASLASVPLASDHNFVGILRLDHPQAAFYSQDDLRFLVTLGEMGAMAIENSQLFQKTQDLAIHDGLTGLYTKGYFLERLKDECKRNMRQGLSFSLLMLDIDLFKNFNDSFGHIAGDIVLKKLALTMTDALKGLSHLISRFGGEEFCAVLPGRDKKNALVIANQLRQAVEKEKIILRRQEMNITVSIGIAGFPSDGMYVDELIQKADRAMYEAKQKGRNRVCSI